MPKFAANLSMMFTEHEFLERFQAAAAAGFEYVEYLFPYEYSPDTLRELLNKYHLKQVLFNTAAGDTTHGEWGRAALPEQVETARADITLALDYARALDCPHVHVMAGVVPDGAEKATYEATFIENIRFAADLFRPHGIKVMLEALSPQVKPNYLLKSQFDTARIVEKVERENVFIQLDYFHAQNVDGNLTRLTEKLFDKVGHIQIASVPDRHEPDAGEIAYPHLFTLLDRLGYDGFVGCEYNPRGITESGLGWFAPYRRA